MSTPKVFISYAHDSQEHKKWVLDLATMLRNNGVDAIIDQWELRPGDDLSLINELNYIIDTLIAARTGSYFATGSAWSFFTQWMQNTIWELISDLPIVGPAMRGLRKTLDDGRT